MADRRTQIHHERRQLLLFRAAIVGALAGLVAVAFQLLVKLAEESTQNLSTDMGIMAWFVIPPLSALLAGLAAYGTQKIAPEAQGSGIPHIKASLMNLRKIVPSRLVPVKIIGGMMALAAGLSLGREGPTVQIGAAIGHLTGKMMGVGRRSLAPLIASGTGAGLAAAFNAPLAGFLFVMEEMKREMSPLTYGTALVATVTAVAVKRAILGQDPEFILGSTGFVPLSALPIVLVVGIVAGVLGILFNRGILHALDFRDKLNWPRWAWGAVIGAAAGVILIVMPSATGGGHHSAEVLLNGEFEAQNIALALLGLLAVKFFLTVFSFSSGAPGGIFAPMLVMGAVMGYGIGLLGDSIFPQLGVVPSFFATIGMAAFLAASVRAPLTGVVLVFEMTAEYRLLYALLLGAFVAYAIAEGFKDKPIYEALLDRDLHKNKEGLPQEDRPEVVDLFIEPDSLMDGKQIRDLTLPNGCLIVQIQRGDHHVVPDGSTTISEGDIVTLVSEVNTQEEWVALYDAARAPSHP